MHQLPVVHTAIVEDDAQQDMWQTLKQFTDARIALGRVGGSLPTQATLDFKLSHAEAKDAVYASLNTTEMIAALAPFDLPIFSVSSQAKDKSTYLKRPDLGRCLDLKSKQILQAHSQNTKAQYDVLIVIADGLSALAIEQNAVAMCRNLLQSCKAENWRIAPLVLVTGGRVALADEIAEMWNVPMLVVLIGERPGLSAANSLGIYYTWRAKVDTLDSARNCISNVRPAGLRPELATQRLMALMRMSQHMQRSGVELKDLEMIPQIEQDF